MRPPGCPYPGTLHLTQTVINRAMQSFGIFTYSACPKTVNWCFSSQIARMVVVGRTEVKHWLVRAEAMDQ